MNSFSICAHLELAMDEMYRDQIQPHPDEITNIKSHHKEEGESKRKLDENDRKKISDAFEKSSNLLTDPYPELYKICNGMVAPDSVNVQNTLEIGTKQCQQLSASLSADFHKTLKKQVKTMEVLKKSVSIESETVYDLETLFTRLLVV